MKRLQPLTKGKKLGKGYYIDCLAVSLPRMLYMCSNYVSALVENESVKNYIE